jgi:predicted enzyme related to lactoylglutathione lyase
MHFLEFYMLIIEGFDYPTLTVSDLEHSIQFYEEFFDFEVVQKDAETGKVLLRVNDVILGLAESKEYRPHPQAKTRLTFYIDPDDFADALEEIEGKGLEVIEKDINQRKGESITIKDPDGYLLEICYPKVKP